MEGAGCRLFGAGTTPCREELTPDGVVGGSKERTAAYFSAFSRSFFASRVKEAVR